MQEMIDICDFAVGLSRQLYGLTIATERPGHRMMETWHPLGVCRGHHSVQFSGRGLGVERRARLVCGDPVVWKPSEKTPLSALASRRCSQRALRRFGDVPEGLMEVLLGGRERRRVLVDDRARRCCRRTGSTRDGTRSCRKTRRTLGRAMLELGGNNAAIVAPSADLDLALRAIVFAAMGTAGQRCTTLRRLIVEESVYDKIIPRLIARYGSTIVGDPRAAARSSAR